MLKIIKAVALMVLATGLFAEDGHGGDSGGSSSRSESKLPRDIMTNEGLVLLSEAGFSDSFIVEKIVLSRTRFDVSVEGLAYLRQNSLSEELIQFVLEYTARPTITPIMTHRPVSAPPAQPQKAVKAQKTKQVAEAPAEISQSPEPSYERQWLWYPSVPSFYKTPAFPIIRSPAFPPASIPAMATTPLGWIASR